jgi:lipase
VSGVHVRRFGNERAPGVACLHGVTSWGGHFEELAARLAPGHHVIAPDLRGHGDSGREPPWRIEDHLAHLDDALGDGPRVWLGHSFGGRLAFEWAAAHPGAVERLVLLDPAIFVPPHVALLAAEHARRERRYPSFEDAIDRRFEESQLHRAPRELVERELRSHLVEEDGSWRYRYSQAAVVAAYGEMASTPPPFAAVRLPTLLVLGERSYIPYDHLLDAHRDALGDLLQVVVVPGGHSVLWDALDETAAAVAAFLASPA